MRRAAFAAVGGPGGVLVLLLLIAAVAGCVGSGPAPAPPPTAASATAPPPARLAPSTAAPSGEPVRSPTAADMRERVPLVVFGAGSLIAPFDAVETAFEAAHPEIDVRPEYHGSIQVIRHATELHEPIDVVATADASLIPMLMTNTIDPRTGKPYADWYIRFASNRLALAYRAGSNYADEVTGDNWPAVLARGDVRTCIADPRFDAAGYRAFMAVVLAQNRDRKYTYFGPLFKDQFMQPVTLFLDEDVATVTVPEVLETRSGSHVLLRGASIQCLALLESGDVDYAFEYESVIRQHRLKMLALPDEENLGAPEQEANYNKVVVNLDFRRFATVKPSFRGERIGYGITIPASAPHPAEASQFIAFLLGAEGRAIMDAHHHPLFETPLATGYDRMPGALQKLSAAAP